MLQKLKITTYVFILCLFGLTLMTVTPVLALTCMPGGYYKETRTPCDPAKLGLPTPRNSDLGQKKQRSVGRILQKKQKNYDDQQVQRLQRENGDLLTALDYICDLAHNISYNINREHTATRLIQDGGIGTGPENNASIATRSRVASACCQYQDRDFTGYRGERGVVEGKCTNENVYNIWSIPQR
jgi:hypothetical protein